MIERKGSVELLISSDWNNGYFANEFRSKLQEEALSFLIDSGFNVKLSPPSERGGGGEMMLLLRILNTIRQFLGFFKVQFGIYAKKNTDKLSPRFTIELLSQFTTVDSGDWEWDDDISPSVKELIFIGYKLANELRRRYEGYQFDLETNCFYESFDYNLKTFLSFDRMRKSSVGMFLSFLKLINLKSYCRESLTFDSRIFIDQSLSYLDKEGRYLRTRKFYYFKFDKIKKMNKKQRNVLRIWSPKGAFGVKPAF
ncbi:MAG: hypothetical protein ABH826_04800 [Patescibacteria group bacterium]